MPREPDLLKRTRVESMIKKDQSQHEIHRVTGFSRTFIREVARSMNHQFPRNGIEIKKLLTTCTNCGRFVSRSPSRLADRKQIFCCKDCLDAYRVGEKHPNWKGGKTVKTFSQWAQNQSEYKEWRQRALERAGRACEISGRTSDLDVHHIRPKAKFQEMVFSDANALVVSEPVHKYIHKRIHGGLSPEEAIDAAREHFAKS